MASRVLLITFKAPRELIEEADKLVEAGLFSSRSEVLRYALSMLINNYRTYTMSQEKSSWHPPRTP